MPLTASRRSDLMPGMLEMLILRTLDLQPMHGYAIAQHIHRLSQDALRVEEGTLYPALQRMLIKGWMTATWRTSPTTKRRTRVYTLTAAGRRQLGIEQAHFQTMFAALSRVMRG
jgi:PadR family transcriptional regulator